jgi:FHA domain-containing protein
MQVALAADTARLAEAAGAAIERLGPAAGEDRPTVGLTMPGLIPTAPEHEGAPDAAAQAPAISWTSEESAGTAAQLGTVIVPSPAPDASRRIADATTLPLGGATRGRGQPSAGTGGEAAAGVATPTPPAAPDARGADSEALLRALLHGAGVGSLAIPGGLTPQRMFELGQMLRTAIQGVLDLLTARAMAKREVRADMTIIVAADNNPLKFSPNLEAALSHLLAPRGRGFMPPVRAVGDAYENLRSHQIGFMAGMHSALAVVLARFDPHQLESRLTDKSVFDSIMPMNHKAKLWDLYAELYGEISREAEDDFHSLFGREFLRAYQAQVAQLRDRSDAIADD